MTRGYAADGSTNGTAESLPGDRQARATLRRHAVGADNARRFLMTVMGEFLLPDEGVAWTATMIEVLSRFEIDAGTTRQALARTAAAGWLVSERVGRRTRWQLTRAGEQLLVAGTERIYSFAGPSTDWDGRWLLVLTSLPEADRAGRHFLRTRLSWAGLGSPAPGVWVGTHPSRLAEVEDVLDRAGLIATAQVFVAEHLGATTVESMVEQAWDLAALEEEYEGFIDEFSSRRASDPLRRLTELVHAWRRFPWLDPALPRELLPKRWKGAEAAALFHDRHLRWGAAAMEEWRRISAESGPATD
jgi:phenylacetic acid degradation operon negative regulatory protein